MCAILLHVIQVLSSSPSGSGEAQIEVLYICIFWHLADKLANLTVPEEGGRVQAPTPQVLIGH